MTTTSPSLPALPATTSTRALLHQLRNTALGVLQRWRRLRDAHHTRRTLSDLNDRTLRDLGLHRSEIGSFAAEVGGFARRDRRTRCRVGSVA